ncbi:hypothetical protein Ancab_006757 [Ancistrocladus abbreviatus]
MAIVGNSLRQKIIVFLLMLSLSPRMIRCYICLAEYEEGDKIRILPCHHEYHMSCVDKWLKEIHGVCPLCRGSVCEAFRQGPPVDLDASLLRSEHV